MIQLEILARFSEDHAVAERLHDAELDHGYTTVPELRAPGRRCAARRAHRRGSGRAQSQGLADASPRNSLDLGEGGALLRVAGSAH